MRFRVAGWVGLLVLAMSALTPARAGLFDDDIARKQVAEQGRRLEETRAEFKGQVETLSGRLAKMEEAMRGSLITQQSMLELVNQIELLKREIQNLRGQIEVVTNGVESNAKRQRDMYVDLDARLRRVEQGPAAAAPPPAGDAPPPPSAAAVPGPSGYAGSIAVAPGSAPDESRAYEAAQQLRRNGNFQGAITAFQAFLTQYPRSTLAHRALYWVGDSYFNLRDYRNAIAAQQKLMATYPDSASTPDAMLNIASAQAELGEIGAARKTMDTLVARYPASDAAEKAKRRLATLR